MHQLKGLIWKAYKVRLRSPLLTALDVIGPILIMSTYVCFKFLINSQRLPNIEKTGLDASIFRNLNGANSSYLDAPAQLKHHMCNKLLYYQEPPADERLKGFISERCGIELIIQSDKQRLIDKLRMGLEERMDYQKPGADLNKSNSTSGCIQLDGGKGPIYQAAIVMASGGAYELYHTDTAGSAVLHQPNTIGSPYNEYQFPSSDLNSGLVLLELCLGQALSMAATNGGGGGGNNNKTNFPFGQLSKVRAKPYPIVTLPLALPLLFLTIALWPNLCNTIATVWRLSDLNESGLHNYCRMAGVPAGIYWLSQLIVNFIHMAIQSLVLAILLAIPAGKSLLDPISESNITIRWLLLLTFSLALSIHSTFIASIFDKTSHAMLATSLLGVGYSLYPLTFGLQWGPYDFSDFYHIADLTLFNPTTTITAFLQVIYGVHLQTSEPFNWSQLSHRIIGGGVNNMSPGFLWILMIVQSIFWFLLTVFIDQLYYSAPSKNPLSFLFMTINDLCCCNTLGPQQDPNPMKSKTKTVHKTAGSSKSAAPLPDPNRICCSLRQVSVVGPTVMMARTVGDPLKMTPEQLKKLRQSEPMLNMARTQQYQVKSPRRSQSTMRPHSSMASKHSRSGSFSSMTPQPLVLDETLEQHLIWNKTTIKLQNVNMDFRFNQVSFVLGQTDLKELLFAALLSRRQLQAGQVVLDGTHYSASTLNLARQHIGYLGERDVYLNEMTIYENLQFFGGLRDSTYPLYDSETLFLLSLLHLTRRRDDFPAVLTTRSARKLALAVASVGHTKLLLLVEPTLGLRWKPRCQVLNLLKKYKSIRSIVVDTSDIDEAVAFGDRIVLLRNGQVDLDGSPERLSKRLCCGHWLVFEPADQMSKAFTSKSNINSPQTLPPADLEDKIRLLENLTSDLLKKDKLAKLNPIKRSVYEELMRSNVDEKGSKIKSADSQATPNSMHKSKLDNDKLHKTIVILKIRQSPQSLGPLLTLLKMFSSHQVIHGFKLVELAFESLEDVAVLRMSKAVYPDLPPDLLLSLQHRTMTSRQDGDLPRVSVRKMSSDYQVPKVAKPMYGANAMTIIKDRASKRHELVLQVLAILAALLFVGTSLWFLKGSNGLEARNLDKASAGGGGGDEFRIAPVRMASYGLFAEQIDYDLVRQFHYHRVGYFLLSNKPPVSINNQSTIDIGNKTSTYNNPDFNQWKLDKRMTGYIDLKDPDPDKVVVMKVVYKHRVLTVCLILANQETGETTIVFEPYLPHALMTGLKALVEHQLQLSSNNGLNTTTTSTTTTTAGSWKTIHHRFKQDWHQIMRGHLNRRFFYGLGFGLAEGVSIGVLVIAPLRHRSEARIIRVRTNYWLAMAAYDMVLSLVLIFGYLLIIIVLEGNLSPYLLSCCLLVLVLHKIASLPVPYLVSLIAESKLSGFFFIALIFITYAWVFSIHIKTFMESMLVGQGYINTIANWIIHIFPVSSLIDSLTNINHIASIDNLCPQVPAFVATNNLVPLEGVYRRNIVAKQLHKVQECLANGKQGIETNMLHQQAFGIIWDICLIMLFGVVLWMFLLFSERVFGIIARRFASIRTSQDTLKTIVRSNETFSHLYKWDRERDRLVSDYIRCMNEAAYVKQMSTNCIYVRIWLKPMSDQTSINRQYLKILEPIVGLGKTKHEVHLELKTTLQLFIRIGNERNHHRLDKIALIEAYTKFVREHEDTVVKFAVIDWTRETLFKILLHGHYNTKSTTAL